VAHPRNPGPLGRCTGTGSGSGPASASRAGLADGFGPRSKKEIFMFPKHFPFNTEVELNPGKILRILRKLWKFSWWLIGIFGTTFVLVTLTKGQPYSNEKWNSDLNLNLDKV
jgi:hypothetical protein